MSAAPRRISASPRAKSSCSAAHARTGSACSPRRARICIADHSDYLALLRKLRASCRASKRSSSAAASASTTCWPIPHDTFFKELVRYHISGQLKVAPEHVSDAVLRVDGQAARTASISSFVEKYNRAQRAGGHEPVRGALSHVLAPGLHDAGGRRAGRISARYRPPARAGAGLLSHALDALDRHVLHRPRSRGRWSRSISPKILHEKAMQRALMQYRRPQNYFLVREALQKAGLDPDRYRLRPQ